MPDTSRPRQTIGAISLVVRDYDEALDFYVGKLGFTRVDDIDEGRKRWVTIRPPGSAPSSTSLLIARAEGARQQAAIGNQTGGRVFLFLTTDNFDRDHRRMVAMGIEFEELPREESYGKVAVWRDPFGNRWDLLQLN